MDRKFILTGLGYAILGLALGLYMGISKQHGQLVTHAHIMLVGFVVSMVYAMMHKLWLNQAAARLARVQYYLHQIGTAGMTLGLFLLYGQFVAENIVGPILGLFSIAVFIGMILMKLMYLKSSKTAV